MKIQKIHIDLINIGDTVFHDGKMRTLSKTDIKRSSFMGTSIFGDSYKLGYKPVLRIIL